MKTLFEEYGSVVISVIATVLIISMLSPVAAAAKNTVLSAIDKYNVHPTVNATGGGGSGGGGGNTSPVYEIVDGDKDGLHYHDNQLFTGDCSDYHYEEGVKQYRTGMLYEKDGYYYFNGTLANGTYYGAKYIMGERFTGVDGSTYYEEGILGTGSYAGVYYKNGEEQFSLNTDLTVLMNDIEAAIQAKTGSTNPIAPDDFPDEINGIKTGKQVFDLGTNTSFDVKTVCQQNGIDYTKLTANNFLILSMSNPGGHYDPTGGSSANISCSFNKSYNASTGVLTCSLSLRSNFTPWNTSGSARVYLVY